MALSACAHSDSGMNRPLNTEFLRSVPPDDTSGLTKVANAAPPVAVDTRLATAMACRAPAAARAAAAAAPAILLLDGPGLAAVTGVIGVIGVTGAGKGVTASGVAGAAGGDGNGVMS